MPKKTRRQKILADVRRTEQTVTPPFTFIASTTALPTITTTYSRKSQPDYLVKKDLAKTLFISTAFIAIEVSLAIFSKWLGW